MAAIARKLCYSKTPGCPVDPLLPTPTRKPLSRAAGILPESTFPFSSRTVQSVLDSAKSDGLRRVRRPATGPGSGLKSPLSLITLPDVAHQLTAGPGVVRAKLDQVIADPGPNIGLDQIVAVANHVALGVYELKNEQFRRRPAPSSCKSIRIRVEAQSGPVHLHRSPDSHLTVRFSSFENSLGIMET